MTVLSRVFTPADEAAALSNVEIEQALLGAILTKNAAYDAVSEYLRPEHFADPLHGIVYAAAASTIEAGMRADPLTLAKGLSSDPLLSQAGGPGYLAMLMQSCVTVLGADSYGQVIHDLWMRRQALEVLREAAERIRLPRDQETASEVIERLEADMARLTGDAIPADAVQDMPAAVGKALAMVEAAYKADGKMRGTTTGLIDLDRRTGGLHSTDLVILAGRPSMGKSALAGCIALAAAHAGAPTAVFSLEMSTEQWALRDLAREADLPHGIVKDGKLHPAQWDALRSAADSLRALPLFIDDTPALSVQAIRTRARRIKRKHGLGLIVVDYLQLMRVPGSKGDNRVNDVSEITRGLKALAKELQVPVLALSQLSRQVESRDDKRPQLSDLRESGSIEQDADVVMFVFREEYYLDRGQPPEGHKKRADWETAKAAVAGLAEILIAKQRHGAIGTVTAAWIGDRMKFADLHQGGGQ